MNLAKSNRKRPAGKTLPNMYLITIPRCDLPKKFIFRGLEPICDRLLVSKENHTISYLDSCCKNSSVKKKNSFEGRVDKQFFNKEEYFFSLLNKMKGSDENCLLRENEQTSKNAYQLTENLTSDSNCSIFENEKKINNPCTSKQADEQNFQTNVGNFGVDEDDWIHCKSHLHIFAGNIKIFNQIKCFNFVNI